MYVPTDAYPSKAVIIRAEPNVSAMYVNHISPYIHLRGQFLANITVRYVCMYRTYIPTTLQMWSANQSPRCARLGPGDRY